MVSHAEGVSIIASGNISHVEGQYNVADKANIYAHIIGNGTNDTARSNAFTVDWSGNVIASGTTTSTQFKLSALNTAPASATDTGTLGEIRITSGYVYVCVGTNTWVRSALTTW